MNRAVVVGAALVVAGGAFMLSQRVTMLSQLPLPKGSYRVSSPYGPRVSPITGKPVVHEGIDLAAPTGTPVYAVETGIVSRVDTDTSKPNGLAVFVRGASGRLWCYLHMSVIDVELGQPVAAGKRLGAVGTTGASTGPHLHLQVYEVGGGTVDPATIVQGLT